MAVVRSEIEIAAPASRVWEILTDLERYPDWNPFTPKVESTLEVGAPVHLHTRLRSERLAHRVETVTEHVPGERICWGMTMGPRFVLAAERRQILTPIDVDRTRYLTDDTLTGMLTPIVTTFWGEAMQRGFDDVAEALKKRAES
jgi:hypothetical protein